jgi:8-oxo-dGTP pyrophosphatase MutT (NUDIX family)
LRGFLGVLTVGVHLNVFSRDHNTGEYRIWVAKRALGREFSYSGMLDQIVAGGVDDKDQDHGLLNPENTLIREAREEVGLEIDPLTQKVFAPGTKTADTTRPRTAIGKVKRASWISFFDCKDFHAGELNENQLEPGVRIIYDLEVKNDFVPRAREAGIQRLVRMTVSQVKESLLDEFPRWKPNCGLVMLDFLRRRGLINDDPKDKSNYDPNYDRIVDDLQPNIPFKFAEQFRK